MAKNLETLLDVLKAIGEPTRLRILALCLNGELSVNELCEILGQSQPRTSRHLKLLVDAQILEKIPEGNSIFHRLSQTSKGSDIAKHIATLIPADDEELLQDQKRLEKIKMERAAIASRYFELNASNWNTMRTLHIDEAEVEKAITTLIPPSQVGTLLDVGTGTGRILEIYGPHTTSSEGIDQSRPMLSLARTTIEQNKIPNCRVRQGDMYNLPYSAGSFDTILFHQVLHFADDPAQAISEAARALLPGGKILIVDFAPHTIESLRKAHAHRRLGFSEQEINDLFKASDLIPHPTQHLEGDPLTVSLWLAQSAPSTGAPL